MSFRDNTVTVVGHRGGRGEGWPAENTLAAFERARSEGAHAIELDVRTCATGEVVVFHDPSLARMTRGEDTRPVADVGWSDLAHVRLGDADERIPLLAEVLAWTLRAGMSVNVELKHDVPSRHALASSVAPLVRASRADVLLSSFHPALLASMAARAPTLPRALLTSSRQGAFAAALREVARPPALFAIHLERTQTAPDAVQRYKRRGLRVGSWTVNDPREAADLRALGVDYIITDSPGAIRAAVSASDRRSRPG